MSTPTLRLKQSFNLTQLGFDPGQIGSMTAARGSDGRICMYALFQNGGVFQFVQNDPSGDSYRFYSLDLPELPPDSGGAIAGAYDGRIYVFTNAVYGNPDGGPWEPYFTSRSVPVQQDAWTVWEESKLLIWPDFFIPTIDYNDAQLLLFGVTDPAGPLAYFEMTDSGTSPWKWNVLPKPNSGPSNMNGMFGNGASMITGRVVGSPATTGSLVPFIVCRQDGSGSILYYVWSAGTWNDSLQQLGGFGQPAVGRRSDGRMVVFTYFAQNQSPSSLPDGVIYSVEDDLSAAPPRWFQSYPIAPVEGQPFSNSPGNAPIFPANLQDGSLAIFLAGTTSTGQLQTWWAYETPNSGLSEGNFSAGRFEQLNWDFVPLVFRTNNLDGSLELFGVQASDQNVIAIWTDSPS